MRSQMTSGLALMIPPRVVNMPDIGVEMHFGPEYCLTVRSGNIAEDEWSHRADAMANGEQIAGFGRNEHEAVFALRKLGGEYVLIPPRPGVGYGSVDALREAGK